MNLFCRRSLLPIWKDLHRGSMSPVGSPNWFHYSCNRENSVVSSTLCLSILRRNIKKPLLTATEWTAQIHFFFKNLVFLIRRKKYSFSRLIKMLVCRFVIEISPTFFFNEKNAWNMACDVPAPPIVENGVKQPQRQVKEFGHWLTAMPLLYSGRLQRKNLWNANVFHLLVNAMVENRTLRIFWGIGFILNQCLSSVLHNVQSFSNCILIFRDIYITLTLQDNNIKRLLLYQFGKMPAGESTTVLIIQKITIFSALGLSGLCCGLRDDPHNVPQCTYSWRHQQKQGSLVWSWIPASSLGK